MKIARLVLVCVASFAACSGGGSTTKTFASGTYVAYSADDPVGAALTLTRHGTQVSGSVFFSAQNGSAIDASTFTGNVNSDLATLTFASGRVLIASWGAGSDAHGDRGFELADCGVLFPAGLIRVRTDCDFHAQASS